MTLTKTQKEIVKTIRRLHRQGEPLNITAVKRRHPELMAAVYAVKPFWGWKRALEAAGIRYSEINVEIQDLCECEICHARKTILTFHLLYKHGVNVEDYRIDYPEADVICEELRAQRRKMACQEMPHWEPLWTGEYALDRLWARYEKGMPINCQAIILNDPSLMIALQRHFRFCDTAFSAHDTALRKLGLNPEDIRRKPLSLKSKKEVIDRILRRRKLHLPLNFIGLKKNKIKALYRGAVRMFGSWKKAIEATGLDYNVIRKSPPKYPMPEMVLHEILRRRKGGLPLNAKALTQGGKNGDETLYRKAREFFGSWKKALRTAGIRYKDIMIVSGPPRKYPTPEMVIAEIQRRQKAGLSIRYVDIRKGPHADFGLYNNAHRYFGHWGKAVEAAGIPYDKVRLRK